jgi:hypothetical protein
MAAGLRCDKANQNVPCMVPVAELVVGRRCLPRSIPLPELSNPRRQRGTGLDVRQRPATRMRVAGIIRSEPTLAGNQQPKIKRPSISRQRGWPCSPWVDVRIA